MPNDWGALGLGGVGRVDIRGATPPIGNTGPGGVEGMGLLALLRRLSMGMDDRNAGPAGLPEPMSPDPAAGRGMPQTLGGQGDMVDMGRMMMGLEQPADDLSGGAGQDRMGSIQGATPDDLAATGQPMQPMQPMPGMELPTTPMDQEPGAFDFAQAFGQPYTPPDPILGNRGATSAARGWNAVDPQGIGVGTAQPPPGGDQNAELWQMLRRMGVP